MVTIQSQNFGVEIEMTGVSRGTAASVIANYFGVGGIHFAGGTYQTYEAKDSKGRVWKCMRDSSITPRRHRGGAIVEADDTYRCEVVTPILQYEDITDLQEVIRALVKKGAMANSSCGIHVHVDGANHTPESLCRLLNFATGRQDLFYEALQIGSRADHWCHKINPALFREMKKNGRASRNDAERIWYSVANDGYDGGVDSSHYNSTRYHGINLHAFFTKGTVEFRLFNGTTHAGRIKAYAFALNFFYIIRNNHIPDLESQSAASVDGFETEHLIKDNIVGTIGLPHEVIDHVRRHKRVLELNPVIPFSSCHYQPPLERQVVAVIDDREIVRVALRVAGLLPAGGTLLPLLPLVLGGEAHLLRLLVLIGRLLVGLLVARRRCLTAIIHSLLRFGAAKVNLLDHKLGGGALLTVLVFVGAGLALALHKSRASLAEILANELCRFTPCHEIQPIGSPPAILTDIVPVNGHAKAGDCQAALCGPHFRIGSEAALKYAIIQHARPPA